MSVAWVALPANLYTWPATGTVLAGAQQAWADLGTAAVTCGTTMTQFAGYACTTTATAYPPAGWVMPENATWDQARLAGMCCEAETAREQREARRAAADARAAALLMSLLTREQRESYARRGWFEVTGSAGGRWRITSRGQAGNVCELGGDGEVVATWCCHPPGGLPDADAHIAQMLDLETNERGFREAGNRTAVPRARLAVLAGWGRRVPPGGFGVGGRVADAQLGGAGRVGLGLVQDGAGGVSGRQFRQVPPDLEVVLAGAAGPVQVRVPAVGPVVAAPGTGA